MMTSVNRGIAGRKQTFEGQKMIDLLTRITYAKRMKHITFGSYVREARLALGIKQNEAARRMGISYQMLSDIERESRVPDLDRVNAIAKVLDLDVDYLAYLLNWWPAPERHGEKLGVDEFKARMEAFRR
jgi:DNA-binding XRE family transcriptional regulator